jgi:hypothetical protein
MLSILEEQHLNKNVVLKSLEQFWYHKQLNKSEGRSLEALFVEGVKT